MSNSFQLKEGTLLHDGMYRVVRYITSGGFGCTYAAEHVSLGKRVAIKELFVTDFCLRNDATNRVTVATEHKQPLFDKLKRKFMDEARALASLDHRNIVRVSDVFEENGTAYFVMNYIDGESLADRVRRMGKLPEAEALRYIRQVAEALRQVHAAKMLHLDIKPGNIMVNANDEAVLIDFGASKQYDEANGENTSTLVGRTPGYAPPEQMTSSKLVQFNAATDIYSLGATLYRLITGKTPPIATDRSAGADELRLDGLSDNVRRAIKAAMQLNVGNRPQTIDAFLARLAKDPKKSKIKDVHKKVITKIKDALQKATQSSKKGLGTSTEETEKIEIGTVLEPPIIDEDTLIDVGKHPNSNVNPRPEVQKKNKFKDIRKKITKHRKEAIGIAAVIVCLVTLLSIVPFCSSGSNGSDSDSISAVSANEPTYREGEAGLLITDNGIKYRTLSGTTCKIANNRESISGDITIPEYIIHDNAKYTVTEVGDSAFYYCPGLTSVNLPKSVKTIGENAFKDCDGLTSVTIPNSVTTIGEGAFSWCRRLERFEGKFATSDHRCLIVNGCLIAFAPVGISNYSISNSVTTIGKEAFYDCVGLTSVSIPNSVTTIGEYAFWGCDGLTSVTIPNSVTTIGEEAFNNCKGLTSVSIPNSVTTIGDYAFMNCYGLTSVTIENPDVSIGDCAFWFTPWGREYGFEGQKRPR